MAINESSYNQTSSFFRQYQSFQSLFSFPLWSSFSLLFLFFFSFSSLVIFFFTFPSLSSFFLLLPLLSLVNDVTLTPPRCLTVTAIGHTFATGTVRTDNSLNSPQFLPFTYNLITFFFQIIFSQFFLCLLFSLLSNFYFFNSTR